MKKSKSTTAKENGLERRKFLKGAAAVGGVAAGSGLITGFQW